MTIEYRGATFHLAPASDGKLFGRAGNCDLHIAPELLKDFVDRGRMIVKMTTPRDEHDPGEVVSATCEHCHTEYADVPRDRPKCVSCGATGCPSCFSRDMFESHFDHCDMCDEVICKACFRPVDGARCCPKQECHKAASDIAEAARATARAHQQSRHPRWRAS